MVPQVVTAHTAERLYRLTCWRATAINFSHDLFSPSNCIVDGADRGRNPLSAFILCQLPGSKNAHRIYMAQARPFIRPLARCDSRVGLAASHRPVILRLVTTL